jgi:hypothetical protein
MNYENKRSNFRLNYSNLLNNFYARARARDGIKRADNKAQKHNVFLRQPFESPMQTRLKGKRIHPGINIHSE